MKISNKLPNKKTETLGVFKAVNSQASPSTNTLGSTDTSSLTTLSSTHMFQR